MGPRTKSLPDRILRRRKDSPSKRGAPRKSEAELLETYLAYRARLRAKYAADAINRPPKKKTGPRPKWTTEEERKRLAAERYRLWIASKPGYEAAKYRRQRAENPERFRLASKRRLARPEQNISNRMRSRIKAAIRFHSVQGSGRKNGRSWEALVGYSRADLMAHIERQFKGRMSWANFGKWHIDHIVPVASFTFQSVDDPEFRACWALTNLRPLWKAANIRKASKRTHLL